MASKTQEIVPEASFGGDLRPFINTLEVCVNFAHQRVLGAPLTGRALVKAFTF